MIRIVILPVLLALCLPSVYASEVYTDNVVIVLDASGSMQERMRDTQVVKMDAAKQALHEVLKHVPVTTHIGLLVFGDTQARDWIYPLGPRDEAQLRMAIDRPQPGGGTPLGKYLKIGADRLLEEREKQFGYGSYRLLVVTDGEATDKQEMERVAPLIMQRGVITLDVIGVSMQGRHTLATMAHSYRQADDPASLARAIQEVLAEVPAGDATDKGLTVFDEIASLPASFAASLLTALATTGNQPIGEQPVTASSTVVPAPQAVTHGVPVQRSPARPAGRKPFKPMYLLVILFSFVVVFQQMKKKKYRRHR